MTGVYKSWGQTSRPKLSIFSSVWGGYTKLKRENNARKKVAVTVPVVILKLDLQRSAFS